MKKNLLAAGALWIIIAVMVLIELAIEYLRPHAAKLWLGLIGVSVAALVLLLGLRLI